jgi:hypothetical protein
MMLVDFLPRIPATSSTCLQYFQLLNELLRRIPKDTFSMPNSNGKVGFPFLQSLADQVIQLIKDHPTVEVATCSIQCNVFKTYDSSPEDQVLIGLINLMCTLIAVQPSFKKAASEYAFHEFRLTVLAAAF